MVSAIDATKPADGVPAVKSDLRGNLTVAAAEISALQSQLAAALSALQLAVGETTFGVITGANFPAVPANLITILQALDTAISGAGGIGSVALEDITNIASPSDTIRRNFQKPLEVSAESADFNFDENAHGGAFVPLNNAANSVRCTLPAAGSLARPDGHVVTLCPLSGAFNASVLAPTDTLRVQTGFSGITVTQTEAFLGYSQTNGLRVVVDVFKDGTLYIVRGQVRTASGANIAIGAPGSFPGSALAALSLPASAFPNTLDLGGTKQAGGGRGILETISGNHTFLQANAGKVLEHTGAGAATWQVPALLAGTTVDVDNAAGGEISYTVLDSQTPAGGLTLAAGAVGAVRWLSGNKVRFVGTV